MNTIKTKDGVEIFYKDWGNGQAIVFSHGWPLSADDWDAQMLFFLSNGYRVIAHDRRGHGRSTQTGDGHDMDHYADDLAALTSHLDLKNAIHVDLPPDEARVLYAVQQPFKKSLTTEKTTNAAWRTKPSFYAVSTQDRTINPDLERFMAKRMGAKTIEIDASHLALISQPDAITNLIMEALAV
jgi:pimeloyl-ACP methyl ester carboxylesterase